ncbi:MAG TPA: hypothetical protein VJQ47_12530 [Steroidobacteraceae bacterium]|nr:hypothetical protein [Steroidobacteraceae bacterium]
MPWPIRQPARSEFSDPAELKAYAEVVSRAIAMGFADAEVNAPYYGQLLHSPILSACLSTMGKVVRAAGDRGDSFTHADREWVDQVLALELNTEIVQGSHLPDAISVGVRIEAIEALRAGRESELRPEEALLVNFIRKTVRGEMDAPTWNAVEARMGERGVVEYAIFVVYLQLTMRLIQCLGPTKPPTRAEIDAMVADFRHGRRQVPNYRDRIK